MRNKGVARARHDGTIFVVGGSLVGALGNYAFQFLGGRTLGSEEYAPITVLWTVWFLVFTVVLLPIEQMTVRRITLSPNHDVRRDVPLIAAIVATAAVFVLVALLVARDSLLGGHALLGFQAAGLVVGYAVYIVARGVLGGRRRFRAYGLATASVSVFRLALTVPILLLAASSVGIAWAMVAAPWIALAFRPFTRPKSTEPSVNVGAASGFVATLILANAASHALLAAGPIVVGALGAEPAAISVFFITLILVRAPLTFSYGLQSRLLEPMAAMVRDGRSTELATWAKRMVLAGAALLIPAWFVGRAIVPTVVQALFGAEFRPAAALGGPIAAGALAAIVSVFTGQIMVARGRTIRLAGAWLVGLVAAVLVIALGGQDPDVRVAQAFMTGEVVALGAIGLAAVYDSGARGMAPVGPIDDAV